VSSNGHSPKELSWDRVRARLALADRALREVDVPDPAGARALLEARARRLAVPLPQPPRPGELLDVVIFSLARERYAIETRVLREIVALTDYTPVPGAADFLVGVINLRGEILAVVDLRRFFNLPDRGLGDQSRVLVLGMEGKELGVLADSAHEVQRLRADQIISLPPAAPSGGRAYLRGVTEDALLVLDGERLLRDPRLIIDQGEGMRERAE
jgi:purine-binding chemotaxis protein CheW